MPKDRYLQAVRGAAITAVVFIHCLPQCDVSVALRPLLNWAVAAFLFLSGLLTTEASIARGGVLERRLWRTLPPYVVWSLAYALLLQGSGTWGALKALLTAGAAAQMYFIAVYLQLTMLTSLLYRLLRWRPLIVYAVTPLSLAAYEVLTAVGVALPILGRLFPMWLVFYVVGLDWERWRARLQGKFRAALVALGACLAIQLVSGFAWLHLGDYNMATTQLKLSSMATSLCVIAVIMLLPASEKHRLSESFLAGVGDASFGIYLCHMFVLAVVRKVLVFFVLPSVAGTALLWLLTMILSLAFCVLVRKGAPRRVAKLLGMS